MNLKEIQELIKLVDKFKLTEVAIEDKDFKLSIKADANTGGQITVGAQTPVPTRTIPPDTTIVQQVQSAAELAAGQTVTTESAEGSKENITIIKSPMIGTFYRKPSPDKETFVKIGDEIQEGTSLCVIEAMKLFNEIESEISGKIIKILVEDASPVEYDQPLFEVDTSGS
ncbi:MAG: acetyl-CoA carboxylase biotin carboxyl carrier protein [Bacteroidetes bacterium]|nr:acetyl-CoA carboxylase biotin carboxyl carrier protein [Bacteroidota bacterium]